MSLLALWGLIHVANKNTSVEKSKILAAEIFYLNGLSPVQVFVLVWRVVVVLLPALHPFGLLALMSGAGEKGTVLVQQPTRFLQAQTKFCRIDRSYVYNEKLRFKSEAKRILRVNNLNSRCGQIKIWYKFGGTKRVSQVFFCSHSSLLHFVPP